MAEPGTRPAPPDAASADLSRRKAGAPPLLLLCDHRGEGVAALLPALESAGYRVEASAQLRGTLERLGRSRPDVILLDPLSSGTSVELEAIDRACGPGSAPGSAASGDGSAPGNGGGHRGGGTDTPVLVVADGGDAIPGLLRSRKRALWDLVHRGAPPDEILMRLERLQSQAAWTAELEEVRYRAAHDDRTDLLRPHSFTARLREHFSAAQRHEFELALLLIDLDKFGQINKRYDHTVGDALITRVGEAIRKQLRTEDVAGRLGGDEFAVLLPYTGKVDAANVVQRLVDRIRELSGPLPGAGEHVQTGASIGFETYNGKAKDLDAVETLRMHAERALRSAKRSGGNCGVYYRSLEAEPD